MVGWHYINHVSQAKRYSLYHNERLNTVPLPLHRYLLPRTSYGCRSNG